MRSGAAGALLFGLCGGALLCSVAALAAFSFELLLAGRTIRDKSTLMQTSEDVGAALRQI